MLPFFERVKTWWTTADSKQKIVILGGMGALFLVLLGTMVVATRPHYETLYEGLSDTEKASVVEALKAGSDPLDPQIGRPGAIDLPTSQIPIAHLKLATAGKSPKGVTHWGANDLAKGSLLTSPGTEAQMLNTVREGEIASALETMQGVGSANVLITTPKERLFADDQAHPTASVTLVENGQGGLSPANGHIIASLVCSAVAGMTPADVVVVTSAGVQLWDGRENDLGITKWDQDKKVAHDVQGEIQSALDLTLGAGNTKVLVRADVNNDKQKTIKHDIDPTAKPVNVVAENESAKRMPSAAGGAVGASANTTDRAPAAVPAAGNAVGDYEKKGNSKEYGQSTLDDETIRGSGGLKGMAITVIANSEKVLDESKVKSIVDGVMGGLVQTDATGLPLRNQPFTTTVTSLKFSDAGAQAAKEAADRLAGQQRMQSILALLPIAAVIAVALLVAKGVGKISRAVLPVPLAPEPEPEEVMSSLAEGPDALEAGDDLGMLPEAAFLEGLADQFDAAVANTPSLTRGYDLDEEDLPPSLRPIKDRVDRPLETLRLLAEQRPELVATLIKSVMLGEKL